MTFTNRNGVLYVSINGVRKSTKLKYSKNNIKKFQSYYEDDEFFNNIKKKKNIPLVLDLVDEYLNEKEITKSCNFSVSQSMKPINARRRRLSTFMVDNLVLEVALIFSEFNGF